MKREPIKNQKKGSDLSFLESLDPDIIVEIKWPLFFWKPCAICNQEFRREKGYYIMTHNWYLPVRADRSLRMLGAPFYVCGDHTLQEIKEYCEKKMTPPPRPKGRPPGQKPTPAPPSKRYPKGEK